MKKFLLLLSIAINDIGGIGGTGFAAEPPPNLPPSEIVAQLLTTHPTVQAAGSQVRAEEANRSRLEAGHYEWSLRIGGQQRKTTPATGLNERYNEWNAAIERPLRLPGKASLDAELGAAGVALAEVAHGDALHETGRNLLKSWFVWLKESAGASQWADQVALLEKQAKAVQRRQQLGDAAHLESIQGEAALAQAQAQLAQAEVRQRTAGEDLRRRFPGLPLNETATIAEPVAITGTADDWIAAILAHNHEVGMARGETQRARVFASRSSRDRLPDPTFGVQIARERGGEENVLGAYISIPLPGGARRATADATLAQAAAASNREAAATQKVSAEAASTYYSASAALASWQATRLAAERLTQAADLTARAYQLGEGSLNDLLNSRRLANEAQLAARLIQLDALELRYRLLLDAHQLWAFDEDEHDHP